MHKIFKKISGKIIFPVFLCAFLVLSSSSYAISCTDQSSCGAGRIRSCSGGSVEKLVADPALGADIMFDLSNPVCLAIATTDYVAVKAAIEYMCSNCSIPRPCTSIIPSPIQDTVTLARGGVTAISNRTCSFAYADAAFAFGVEMSKLFITYKIASDTFDGTSICGHNWYTVDKNNYDRNAADYKQTVEEWVKNNPNASFSDQKYREWYYGGQEYEDNPNNEDACRDPTVGTKDLFGNFPTQKYYLTGTAAGNFNCDKYNLSLINTAINPNATADDYNRAYNCCKNRSKNYICIDFNNTSLNNHEVSFCKSGTNCTIQGITFSVAPIETSDSRLICAQSYSLCPYNFTISGGTKYCDYFQDGVQNDYGTYTYITAEQITAASTGDNPTNDCNTKSEIRNADCTFNEKANKCKNYCQYLTHCTVVGNSDYRYRSGLGSPYFSTACYNFVGDSRNSTALASNIIFGRQRHFSAPIAQCVKETLENVFYNRAGHSTCSDPDEYPQPDGTCGSGNYTKTQFDGFDFTYKKGNQVKEYSFFATVQNSLQGAVKMVLTLAIVFYGLKILIAHNMSEIKKSDIMMFIIKIGLVMYFATGDAWQTMFFDGVYNSSTVFSDMVFNIESTLPDAKKDGCQFDDVTLAQNPYPNGKQYLSIWDTLDCKIMRYLGFGPQASVANLAMLVFAGAITGGPIGIYFAVGLMFFGFLFITLTIRALQIFLFSVISILLMVYLSPIIIPTVLFPKTADIFKKWLTNLISFCLQPMILFAYIGILISVIDSTVIGSATFRGTPPYKDTVCNKVCEDYSGNLVTGDANCSQTGHSLVGGTCQDNGGNVISADNDPTCTGSGHSLIGATCQDASGNNVGGDPDCNQAGHHYVDPNSDSIACMINLDDYGKVPFLADIGIALPALYNFFDSNVKEKILTIMKAAFIVFVLAQFMDQIPEITSQLIGGSSIKADHLKKVFNTANMMRQVKDYGKGFSDRVRRGGAKAASSTYEKIKDKVGSGGSASSSSAPSSSQGGNTTGGDSSGENGSGGDDSGGNDSGGDGGDSNGSGSG